MSDEPVTCAIWDDQEPVRSIEQQRADEAAEAIAEANQRIIDQAIWERYSTFFDRDGNRIRPFKLY